MLPRRRLGDQPGTRRPRCRRRRRRARRRRVLHTSSSNAQRDAVELRPEERVLGPHGGVGPAEQGAGGGGVDRELEARAAERRVVGRDACSSPSGLPVLWSVTTSVPSGSSSTRSICPRNAIVRPSGSASSTRLVVAEVAARTAGPCGRPSRGGRSASQRVELRPAARPAVVDPERRPGPVRPAAGARRPTSAPASLQGGGVLVGPARRARGGERAVEHRALQAVDGVVDGRAAVERAQRLDVGRARRSGGRRGRSCTK